MTHGARITVVGIGADGWDGLTEPAREAIHAADEVIGSQRQLATLPPSTPPQRAWPSPLQPLLDDIVARPDGHVCVLASGDPMQFGIGATLVNRLGSEAVTEGRLRVLTHPSAYALTLARIGWGADGVALVSAVGRPHTAVLRLLQPGRRFVAYVTGVSGAAQLAAAITQAGFARSRLWVCEQLGGAGERVIDGTAGQWGERQHDPLSTVAVEVIAGPAGRFLATTPGLPDDAFIHDGQISKRHVRAITLAALAPAPGQLLWDIGAGSGSIAIEWLRAEPTARAIAIEQHADRAGRITENANALGTPGLAVLTGTVPDALTDLSDDPDAVFIGGGLTSGVLELAWDRLAAGGRLVANAVTIEGEQVLLAAHQTHGGELVKLSVSHAEPLGGFSAWRPALPIVQWASWKQG